MQVLNKRKLYSIKKDFYISSLVMIFIMSIVFIFIASSLYFVTKQENYDNSKKQAILIESALIDSFGFIEFYTKFLGEKIINKSKADPSFISRLFYSESRDQNLKEDLYSWTLFDWITPEKKLVVSTKHGVLPKQIDMSTRTYLDETSKTPWKLFFSAPSKGIPSGELVIPSGVGVIDESGKFYGTICTGFSIKKLKQKLERIVTDTTINFIIMDEKFNLVTSSINHEISSPEEAKLSNYLKRFSIADSSLLPIEFSLNDYSVNYIYKSQKYPFYILLAKNKQYMQNKFWNQFMPRILEISVIGFFCIGILYFFRKKMLTPLMELTDAARSINKNEKVTIPNCHYEEFQILADQLERVAIQQEQLNDALRQKTRALALKDEFIRNLSHETRTPLTGIVSLSEFLSRNWAEMDEDVKYDTAMLVAQSGTRLLSLMNNLLDLSKLTTGKQEFNFESVNLLVIVKEVINLEMPLYTAELQRHFEFPVNTVVSSPIVYADREKITQVIRNLYINAVKFMEQIRASGDITATIEPKNNGILFCLKDHGPGIPEDELTDIFLAFFQSSKTKTGAGGTGIGLAICKDIVEAHKGRIWAKNIPGGTAFFVWLPSPLATSNYDEAKNVQNNEFSSENSHTFETIAIQDRQIKTDTSKNVKKTQIVLIDDEKIIHSTVKLYLAHIKNIEIKAFIDGAEAVKYMLKNKVDLILLDWMMPAFSGLETLRLIKKHEVLSEKKVIIQTGITKERLRDEAGSLKIDGMIAKPFDYRYSKKIQSLINSM
ncbi:MAG: ATP-binding protein [Rickettsiaceae bacterium]|nr:ATP-binding protein [Rickettsiaceae bacterium]